MKYKLNVKRDVDTDEPGVFILNLPYGFRFEDSHEDNPEHVRGFDTMREVRDEAKTNVIVCSCWRCSAAKSKGIKMSDTTYNGWTNYATWRVNLEFFDDGASEYYKTAQEMREYVEDYIDQETADGFAKSYAYAFLSDVNWYEIASHHQEEEEEEEESEES